MGREIPWRELATRSVSRYLECGVLSRHGLLEQWCLPPVSWSVARLLLEMVITRHHVTSALVFLGC